MLYNGFVTVSRGRLSSVEYDIVLLETATFMHASAEIKQNNFLYRQKRK